MRPNKQIVITTGMACAAAMALENEREELNARFRARHANYSRVERVAAGAARAARKGLAAARAAEASAHRDSQYPIAKIICAPIDPAMAPGV